MDVDDRFPWFAVNVRTRAEELVGSALGSKGYQVFVPTYLECRRYASCVKKVNAALFPGYLFCRLDLTHRLPLLQTSGVNHIVSMGGDFRPLEETEISAIRRVVDSKLPTLPWPYLTTGHRARIECGPFVGMEGIVTKFKGRERLVLSVDLLQRSVAVEIDRSWIRPMGAAGPGSLTLPPRTHSAGA